MPAVARALPRPGAWMDTFRRFPGLPMFATVVWLVWVLGPAKRHRWRGLLLILLVGLGLLAWSLACQAAHGAGWQRGHHGGHGLAAVGLWPPCHAWPTVAAAPANATATAAPAGSPGPRRWQRPCGQRTPGVCGLHRRVVRDLPVQQETTLANSEVLADLHAKNVALLRADWTRRDPPSPPPWPSWAAMGCRCVCSTAQASPGGADQVLSVDEVRSTIAQL